MKSFALARFASCLLVVVLVPSLALAVVNYYDDQATFHAATGPLDLESLEGLPATNSPTTDTFVLDHLTIFATAGPTSMGIWNEPYNGSFATDGVNYIRYQCDADQSLVFTFVMPINAFGINVTDWGDFGEGVMTFSNELGDFAEVDVTPNSDGHLQFFGTWNTDFLFTTVTFTQSITGEAYGVDEIYYGTAGTVAVEETNWSSVKALFAD